MDMDERKRLLSEELANRFGDRGPATFFRAPGRVDLMGSHTDYNQGFILAATVDRDIVAAARPRNNGAAHLYSLNTDLEIRVHLDHIRFDREHGWANYPKGVIREALDLKIPLAGMDMAVHGDVPVGGNLSSSAALEAVTCEALLGAADRSLPAWEKVHLCWRAENVFVGMPCGVMDQFTVIMGEEDRALLLDCRSLDHEAIPFFQARSSLVVIDSGLGRELSASRYAERVRECEEAVKILKQRAPKIKSLRDATIEDVRAASGSLGDVLTRRARHVVSENRRVHEAADAMREDNAEALGRIMEENFISCRDDYDNSTPELTRLHDLAAAAPGAFGARIAGAGWGGCLLSLVETARLEAFVETLAEQSREKLGREAVAWPVKTSAGAGPL